MKAFQLKMVIKNSKPPIWRRIIVPSGITFSQLSIILNKAMGWCGYHLFQFEFYHMELMIMEDIQDFDCGYGPYDYAEASELFIREYLEQNDWFTYTYDLGDSWDHRVTVEKIIDDYEYDYPMVIKYKGECPVEDCGGIGGYYECLEVINNPNHPENQERMEWMEMQGYSQEYDIEAVNENLRISCYYKWGKGENRFQNEIYDEVFNNKGLKATKKDYNKNAQVNISGKHEMEKALEQIAINLREMGRFESLFQAPVYNTTLTSILQSFEKKLILEMAKEKGVKRVSSCSKSELINRVVSHMLSIEIFENYFLCMSDEQIAEFVLVSCKDEPFYTENDLLMDLCESGYIGMLEDGRIDIPIDVKEQYEKIDNESFHQRRKKINYIRTCIQICMELYGITPFSVLHELVVCHPEMKISIDELKGIVMDIPCELARFVIVDDKIYASDLYPDDQGLLKVQGDKEFYIPTKKEIDDYMKNGYFSKDQAIVRFGGFLMKECGETFDDAKYDCFMLQKMLCASASQEDVFAFMEEVGLMDLSEDIIYKLIRELSYLHNDTKLILNRGFSPNEIENKSLKQNNNTNKVISFAQRKKEIGRNELCPCGSGKKYKYCCGKK